MCSCSVDKTAAGCVPPCSLGQLEMGWNRPPRRGLPCSHCSGNAVSLWNGSETGGACIGPILSEDVGATSRSNPDLPANLDPAVGRLWARGGIMLGCVGMPGAERLIQVGSGMLLLVVDRLGTSIILLLA